jgi:hypothetical protein
MTLRMEIAPLFTPEELSNVVPVAERDDFVNVPRPPSRRKSGQGDRPSAAVRRGRGP